MGQIRKDTLHNEGIYHIFNRSIAGYEIFNSSAEFDRMMDLIKLCRFNNFKYSYSQFAELEILRKKIIIEKLKQENDIIVEVVAYCLMPTHIHLALKQVSDDGIIKYLRRILNSYSKYFNTKHSRFGPLWAGRFKNVKVDNDEQLLHLTRYIHLNPTSVKIVDDPKDWIYSSYLEYIKPNKQTNLSKTDIMFNFSPKEYEKFCLDRKSYQQELSIIKSILIDNYTG